MKKIKQILAMGGVILLLLLYASTMVFALLKNPHSQKLFQLSLVMTVLVPVVLYAILLTAKYLTSKQELSKPDSPVQNIIFDIGNVLISFVWDEYLESFHFPYEINAAMHRATWPNPEWEERDRGALTDEEYFQTFLAKAPEYEAELRQVFQGENAALRVFDYSKAWLDYLKAQGYGVYFLSNVSRHMLEGFLDVLPSIGKMDGGIFSCEVQHLKPEPEIYHALMDTYHLKPESCVFLDDRPENVAAAKAVGMHAIHFQDFKSAVKELERLGVR